MAATPIDVGRAWSNNMRKLYLAYEWPQVQPFARKSTATPCRQRA
jgi:hypothetical protein